MPIISEKPEWMKVSSIKVCTKAEIERSPRHKNSVFVHIFNLVAL
tara:strand:- start:38 stop:172 length:135 start_codon:yes stop_codon:yes gene_type:complete